MMRAGGTPRPGVGGNLGGAPSAPRIRTTKSATQSTPTATVDVTWDQETYKTGITHSNVVSSQNFTIVTSGRYLVSCLLTILFDTAGQKASYIHLAVNRQGAGFGVEASSRFFITIDVNELLPHNMHDVLDLLAGDVVKIQYQFSGTGNAVIQATTTAVCDLHRLS